MKEIITEFGSIVLLIISAIISVINAIISGTRAVKLTKLIDSAKERETYVNCPHCGKKIYLSDMNFRLPSGALDNDLDGKPDED